MLEMANKLSTLAQKTLCGSRARAILIRQGACHGGSRRHLAQNSTSPITIPWSSLLDLQS